MPGLQGRALQSAADPWWVPPKNGSSSVQPFSAVVEA